MLSLTAARTSCASSSPRPSSSYSWRAANGKESVCTQPDMQGTIGRRARHTYPDLEGTQQAQLPVHNVQFFDICSHSLQLGHLHPKQNVDQPASACANRRVVHTICSRGDCSSSRVSFGFSHLKRVPARAVVCTHRSLLQLTPSAIRFANCDPDSAKLWWCSVQALPKVMQASVEQAAAFAHGRRDELQEGCERRVQVELLGSLDHPVHHVCPVNLGWGCRR